jgi:hypothetical protein
MAYGVAAMIESIRPAGAAGPTVVAAIKAAAAATGADFDFLVRTAERESGFDASARARTSSATGLFQFTEGTWLRMLERYGERHGVKTSALSREQSLSLRTDPDLSSRMAAELARENAGLLQQRLGRPATSGELYIAHFLGPEDASRLIEAAQTGVQTSAARLFPTAAAANPEVFGLDRATPLTPSELYANLVASRGTPASSATPATHRPEIEAQALSTRLASADLAASLLSALLDIQAEDPDRFLFES